MMWKKWIVNVLKSSWPIQVMVSKQFLNFGKQAKNYNIIFINIYFAPTCSFFVFVFYCKIPNLTILWKSKLNLVFWDSTSFFYMSVCNPFAYIKFRTSNNKLILLTLWVFQKPSHLPEKKINLILSTIFIDAITCLISLRIDNYSK